MIIINQLKASLWFHNREQLWKVLRHFGIPHKYVDLIQMCNNKIMLKIKYQQKC